MTPRTGAAFFRFASSRFKTVTNGDGMTQTIDFRTQPVDTPQQAFGTEGLPPMQRPSLVVRLFMTVISLAERLNRRFAKAGNPPVYDNATFSWTAELERRSPAIRRELEAVLLRKNELPSFQDIVSDVATISKDRGWKTYLLTAYGIKSEQNIRQCPQTWRAVKQIPGLKAAMFSIFEPGKHLPAHRGPYNGVLRFHLGLIVPEPKEKIAIRVGNQVCHWEEGKALIFDDAYEHEAWNFSDHVRVVLFVDFVKPLRFPASLLNWLILNLTMFTPFVQEGHEKHREWERVFHERRGS